MGPSPGRSDKKAAEGVPTCSPEPFHTLFSRETFKKATVGAQKPRSGLWSSCSGNNAQRASRGSSCSDSVTGQAAAELAPKPSTCANVLGSCRAVIQVPQGVRLTRQRNGGHPLPKTSCACQPQHVCVYAHARIRNRIFADEQRHHTTISSHCAAALRPSPRRRASLYIQLSKLQLHVPPGYTAHVIQTCTVLQQVVNSYSTEGARQANYIQQ